MFDIQDVFNWLETVGVKYQDTEEQRELGLSLLNEEFNELYEALRKKDTKEILDGSCDLIWIIVNNLVFNNLNGSDFQNYFKNVSESNWSKICDSEQDAMDTVEAYKNGRHWDKPGEKINCFYKEFNDKWIVYRQDGKIMKSLFYKDVKTFE